MKKHEFIEEIEKYKPIVKGNGRHIAMQSGVSYTTYQNYLRGLASDPLTMNKILDACESYRIRLADSLAKI